MSAADLLQLFVEEGSCKKRGPSGYFRASSQVRLGFYANRPLPSQRVGQGQAREPRRRKGRTRPDPTRGQRPPTAYTCCQAGRRIEGFPIAGDLRRCSRSAQPRFRLSRANSSPLAGGRHPLLTSEVKSKEPSTRDKRRRVWPAHPVPVIDGNRPRHRRQALPPGRRHPGRYG
jgi:hypothetical protein